MSFILSEMSKLSVVIYFTLFLGLTNLALTEQAADKVPATNAAVTTMAAPPTIIYIQSIAV